MQKLYVAVYHYVRDLKYSRYPNIKGMDVRLFKEQIAFFKENFNTVTMEDVLDYYDRGTPLPEKALLLTFDDAFIDHYTVVFPLLRENKMQGSFFVPGQVYAECKMPDMNKIHFIIEKAPVKDIYNEVLRRIDDLISNHECELPSREELLEKYAFDKRFDKKETVFVKQMLQTVLPEDIRHRITAELFDRYVGVDERIFAAELYMTPDQIRFMKRSGMFIGLHGYGHYRLNSLSPEKLKEDMDAAFSAMSDVIDPKNPVMNYPYGSYNEAAAEYLRKIGCRASFTVEPRIADLDRDDRMLLPRLDCNDFPPKSEHYLEV